MNDLKDAATLFGDNIGAAVPIIAPKIRKPLLGIKGTPDSEVTATAVSFETGHDEGAAFGHIYVLQTPNDVEALIAKAAAEGAILVAWVRRTHDRHPDGRQWLLGSLEMLCAHPSNPTNAGVEA